MHKDRNRQLRVWYELEQPHRLVGQRDPENGSEMILVRYSPGRADTLDVEIPDVDLP